MAPQLPKEYWIEQLNLGPHPEGGFYRRNYASREWIPGEALPERYCGDRNFASSIYFLIDSENFSAFHRLQSEESWHFYAGTALMLSIIEPDGTLRQYKLGNDPEKGEALQLWVPHGVWFAAHIEVPDAYSLVGCVVTPGFDFEDFELADRKTLIRIYPQHGGLITRLTR